MPGGSFGLKSWDTEEDCCSQCLAGGGQDVARLPIKRDNTIPTAPKHQCCTGDPDEEETRGIFKVLSIKGQF